MEGFYQESGRAGRDQLPSRSVLYYGMADYKRMVVIQYIRIYMFNAFVVLNKWIYTLW